MILPRTVPGSSAGFSPFMRTRNGLKPALRYLATAGLLLASGVIAARADEIPQQYHDTVKRGLDYLAKQQAKDGHWGAQGGQGDAYPVSMTGLAGIAMLMEGSTVREGKYSANIRKAVD